MNRLSRLVGIFAALIAAMAVANELRYPRGLRSWRGQVAGVPYNLQPSRRGIATSMWNPHGRVLMPQPFGVGWTINLPALLRRLNLWPA